MKNCWITQAMNPSYGVPPGKCDAEDLFPWINVLLLHLAQHTCEGCKHIQRPLNAESLQWWGSYPRSCLSGWPAESWVTRLTCHKSLSVLYVIRIVSSGRRQNPCTYPCSYTKIWGADRNSEMSLLSWKKNTLFHCHVPSFSSRDCRT